MLASGVGKRERRVEGKEGETNGMRKGILEQHTRFVSTDEE